MTISGGKQLTNIRVANFSDLNLPIRNLLNFSTGNVDTVVAKIRQYADLPYIYVVSRDRSEFIIQLLSNLEAIRSPCYPYALFLIEDADVQKDEPDLDIIKIDDGNPAAIVDKINAYAATKFVFDRTKLKFANNTALPKTVDVMIVGAGVTGLYAANYLKEHNLSFCIVDKRDVIGGIWSLYANVTSQVNTSEGAYRLVENKKRTNRDHSATREILEDLVHLAGKTADRLYLNAPVNRIEKTDRGYQTTIMHDQQTYSVRSKGVILAVNDRVGTPRKIEWKNQEIFKGSILAGQTGSNRRHGRFCRRKCKNSTGRRGPPCQSHMQKTRHSVPENNRLP